ncbi:MAG: hypothetical protein HY708_07235 [Ignavibacteriae bacterium]|nr:hypothetical protein [Ignavibacteriota bacterium]
MTRGIIVIALGVVVMNICFGQGNQTNKSTKKTTGAASFKNDVFPIIKKNCLPCHAEDNFNPSELSLDNYELLMTGGKNGVPVVPGKSAESIMIQKLGPNPPFGDPMPLDPKKKKDEPSKKKLSSEDIKTIATWIDEGGKKN